MKTIKVQMDDINQYAGKSYEGENNSPGFDYCRKLIKDGEPEDSRLEVYRDDLLCLIFDPIGKGAKWAIQESAKVDLRIRKYEPFPADKIVKSGAGEQRT